MYESYLILNLNTGAKIAECGCLEDAIIMVNLDPSNRVYRKNKFILDQIIDVTSTTDKQLPGQQGLPSGSVEHLKPHQIKLPEGQGRPLNI